MKLNFTSKVEKCFYEISGEYKISTKIPYITVNNFPDLGLLTSLRFLEWADLNPEGVISLPTGKTPEFLIKYTKYLLENWDNKTGKEIRAKYGLESVKKPVLKNLHFVQIDEFYPISPNQQNSFFSYVNQYYIKGFGFDLEKALLINSDSISLAKNKHYSEVFPDYNIDLSLRYRDPSSKIEEIQQKSIFLIDEWCNSYEQKIRDKGGLGFFLGGIGPDGHIAFNVRGSDHFSTTRLTETNFETQAVAAGDLGGIEVSKNRLVITIGLETIVYNPDVVPIIFAAGEAKAGIVKQSLENEASVLYPASVLHKRENSRFYLTTGAAIQLNDSVDRFYNEGEWTQEKTEKAIIDLCIKSDTYAFNLKLEDLKSDPYCKLIPNLSDETKYEVMESIKRKLDKGISKDRNKTIYHTGPHHDDIMLGIMPYTNRQLRSKANDVHFSVFTSGFTSVTNHFVINAMNDILHFLENDKIQMIHYPDFFEKGFNLKRYKDISHVLDAIAARNEFERRRGFSHRLLRSVVEIFEIKDVESLKEKIKEIITLLENSYDGSKNPPKIQKMKGMIREFEEELVWAHFGVPIKNIHHLRLGFYKGDIFTEQPEKQRDVIPVLEQFRKYQPTIISLALDPEGSGPDTHYKVLQTIVEAIKEWQKEKDLSELTIIGYRNVWYRFHLSDSNMIIPASLNSLDILQSSFSQCYFSQVNASFPSFEHNGKFSELAQRIWVDQMRQVQLVLGKNFFYENENPLLRATHGMVYVKSMNVEEFTKLAASLEKAVEGEFSI